MRITALVALAIATSACSPSNEVERNQPGVAAANASANVIQRISSLSDRQRNAVFIRAIRDAGLECQHVEWSTLSGTYRGMPVWTAACARNQVWVIVVGDDGNAQVLNPAEGLLVYNRLDDEAPAGNGH